MSRATQGDARRGGASRKGLSPAAAGRSGPFRSRRVLRHGGPTTPVPPRRNRFGLFPVRSPLLGESLTYFLFLRVLRCFSSPRLPPHSADGAPSGRRVVPFGNPRITGHLHLPAAYRSLSRPSSLTGAKASSVRPFLLSLVDRTPYKARGRILSAVLHVLLYSFACSVCQRSNGAQTAPKSGEYRIRTDDPLLAKQVL